MQGESMSTLEYLDFWLRSVYAHASANSGTEGGPLLSPPVFIVGTHRDCLNSDPELADKIVRTLTLVHVYVMNSTDAYL